MFIKRILTLIFFLLVSYSLFSQDIPKIIPKDNDPVKTKEESQKEEKKNSDTEKKNTDEIKKEEEKKKEIKGTEETVQTEENKKNEVQKEENKKQENKADSEKKSDKTVETNKKNEIKKEQEKKEEKKALENIEDKTDKILSQEKKTEEKTCIQEEITCPECPEIKTDSLSYSQKSVIELGGAGWVELKGLKGGSLSQRIWISPFVSYFVLDYFLMGIRGDFDYSLDSKTYVMAAYYVVGTALPLTEKLFFVVDMNLGYSKNSSSSSNLFSYGNEVGIKYEISKHFLLGFTAVYNFYTDFSTEYFNDKIKAMISFSGYF